MTATMYHGTYSGELALHVGLCLTDDYTAAARYADQYSGIDGDAPTVHTVELDLTGLNVVELEHAWDSQAETVGEDADRFADAGPASYPGVDVLIYTDYALGVEQMTTYRLLTDQALAAVKITESEKV